MTILTTTTQVDLIPLPSRRPRRRPAWDHEATRVMPLTDPLTDEYPTKRLAIGTQPLQDTPPRLCPLSMPLPPGPLAQAPRAVKLPQDATRRPSQGHAYFHLGNDSFESIEQWRKSAPPAPLPPRRGLVSLLGPSWSAERQITFTVALLLSCMSFLLGMSLG